MNEKIWLVWFVVNITVRNVNSSMRCYCDDEDLGNCRFEHSWPITLFLRNEADCDGACFKVPFKDGYMRGCSQIKEEIDFFPSIKDKVYTCPDIEPFEVEKCLVCNTDLCNDSSKAKSQCLLLVVAMILISKLT